jgi:TolB protein
MRFRSLPLLATLLLAPPACSDAPDASPTGPSAARQPLSEFQVAVLRPASAGRADIFLMNADGSNAVALNSTPEAEYHPSWSPDGQRLVFVRRADPSGVLDLWTMGADGSGAAQLTFPDEHPGEVVFDPAWSPDGTRIAYTQGDRLYLMDPDGKNRRQVGTESNGMIVWVSWSPDGSRLAVERLRPSPGFGFEIATVGADGSGFKVLTPAGVSDSWPAWSPDGKKIAFGTVTGDEKWALAVMNASGHGRRTLTAPPTVHQVSPSWSPDGRWIAYHAYQEGVGAEAIVIRHDGSEPRSLGPSSAVGPVAWRP